MTYNILATPEFEKDYKSLPNDIKKRVIEKINKLVQQPELMKFPLKYMPDSLKGLQKYRIGNYRLLFIPDREKKEIVLYGIAHRKEIYRRLKK
jgi:mRNA-degrading endonuclease RelE of RelBE toxin-antitoxin system